MKAVGKRIIVKMNIVEKTKAGIVLLESAQLSARTSDVWQNMNLLDGTVISVGEDVEGVSVGDTVLVAANSAMRVVLNSEKCAVLKQEEIICKIEAGDTYGKRQ